VKSLDIPLFVKCRVQSEAKDRGIFLLKKVLKSIQALPVKGEVPYADEPRILGSVSNFVIPFKNRINSFSPFLPFYAMNYEL
jgi:hypothetical protein